MKLRDIRESFLKRRYEWLHQRTHDIEISGGAVSITFDDFPLSAASTAGSMLNAKNWYGTFYLAPGLLGRIEDPVGKIVSKNDIVQLCEEGHEIGNHTYDHLSCQGARLAQLRTEHSRSRGFLEEFDGNRHFAFPYGAYDYSSLSYFSGKYQTMRTVTHGINAGRTDLNLLRANPIYSPTKTDRIDALLRETKDSSGWLILYTHDVAAHPSEFGCSIDDFSNLLSAIDKAGLSVETVTSVCRRLGVS